MLSIAALAQGQSKYYLSLTGYYTDGPEPDGYWYGEGAHNLGLEGQVFEKQLTEMCEGFAPDGSGKVQNAGLDTRKHGDDLTFSVPKSVSIAWAIADPEFREDIRHAVHKAVWDALDYIQDEAGYARRGRGGQELTEAPLAFALFEHGTSRLGDPNLHIHCVMPNLVKHLDGLGRPVTAIDSTHIYHHKMAAGALFRASLAHNLMELGFDIEKDRFAFKLGGISDEACQEFSKRRAEITSAILEKYQDIPGLKGKELAAVLKAAAGKMSEIINKETRRGKEEIHTRDELYSHWADVAEKFGITPKLIEDISRHPTLDPILKIGLEDALFQKAITDLEQRHSHFSKSDIIRIAAEEAQLIGIDAGTVRDIVDRNIEREKTLIPLGDLTTAKASAKNNRYVDRQEERFTTQDNLRVEREFIDRVEKLTKTKLLDGERFGYQATAAEAIERTNTQMAEKGHALAPDQVQAIKLVTGPERLTCIQGRAGTGKSTALDTCRIAWEMQGKTVVGCAVAGQAKDELEKSSGIASDTLAMTLIKQQRAHDILTDRYRHEAWDKNTVVVLDEAGMVPTRELNDLLKWVERAGASIVLVGHDKQLQPITAGGPFHSILNRFGELAAELTTIFRQRERWRAEAGTLLMEGNADQALAKYKDHEQFHVTDSRAEAIEKLVEQWKEYGGIENPRSVVSLASTNAEVTLINRFMKGKRMEAGALGTGCITLGGTEVHEGDLIQFRKRDRHLGLENGFYADVVSCFRNTLVARLDDGSLITVDTKEYGKDKIQLGYASTVHKSQGATRERVLGLLGGSMMNLHMAYVAGTRSVEETHFYADKETILPEGGTEHDAIKRLARQLSFDQTKDLALDIMEARDPDRSGPDIPRTTPVIENAIEEERRRAIGQGRPMAISF